jgi:hypothetical protein
MFEQMNAVGYATSFTGLVSLIISGLFYYKAQQLKTSPEMRMAQNEQIQTIFDGYAGVIDTLQDELERLKLKLIILEQEQSACDKRNEVLTIEITDLRTRIECLGG